MFGKSIQQRGDEHVTSDTAYRIEMKLHLALPRFTWEMRQARQLRQGYRADLADTGAYHLKGEHTKVKTRALRHHNLRKQDPFLAHHSYTDTEFIEVFSFYTKRRRGTRQAGACTPTNR